jgi:hypothetical protein
VVLSTKGETFGSKFRNIIDKPPCGNGQGVFVVSLLYHCNCLSNSASMPRAALAGVRTAFGRKTWRHGVSRPDQWEVLGIGKCMESYGRIKVQL